MKSIFAKILAVFVGSLIIAFAGITVTNAVISMTSSSSRQSPPSSPTLRVLLDDATQIYDKEGKPGLEKYIARLERFGVEAPQVTDGAGRSLLTGEDLSALFAPRPPGRPKPGEPIPMTVKTADNKYGMVTVFRPRFRMDPWENMLSYGWILAAVAAMCYLLAFHLASPLVSLRNTLDEFGRGNLTVRTGSKRGDELGELSRSFDRMADRIQTLLGAERRLLQDISHELRSPLARLGFAVELARSSANRDEGLNRIKREAIRLNSMISDLLQVTRVEGDPAALDLHPRALNSLVGELVEEARIEAEARECKLRYYEDQDLTVPVDSELLRRAVDNVLRNAIRHSPDHGAVEITAERSEAGARIVVRDYGAGVPEEATEEIFKPFYRVDTDRNRSAGGTGLGLSIARRAVSAHGGTIKARNANPGLEVTIEIPARNRTTANVTRTVEAPASK